ncbi:MAG: response regulator [Fibrobacterales bacterium]
MLDSEKSKEELIKELQDSRKTIQSFDAVQKEAESKTEQNLQHSAKLLDLIFEHTLDSIVLLDKDYNFIRVSKTYAEACDKHVSEFVGKNHFVMYPSSLKDEFDEVKAKKEVYARSARPFNFPDHPEWETTYWNLGLVPLLDGEGEIEYFLFTLKDVTDNIKKNLKLEENEKQLDFAIKSARLAFWSIDFNESKFLYSNEWLAMLNYESHDVENTIENIITLVHPDDIERSNRALQQHTIGETDHYFVELRLLDGNHNWRWIAAKGTIFERDASGAPLKMIGLNEDISKRKELEHKIAATDKLNAVGQVASGVAHDFRNALGGIIGYITLAEKKIGPNNSNVSEYLNKAISVCNKSAGICGQLLNFAGDATIVVESLDMHKIINNVIDVMKHSFDKRITFHTSFDTEKSVVMGDSAVLENLFLNLGLNAQDAIVGEGDIEITTSIIQSSEYDFPEDRELSDDKYLEVSFKDTGMGMSKELKERVFEPFFTTKEFGKGTGLGLSSVFGSIKQLGGHVAVDSKVGEGTVFTLLFPLSKNKQTITPIEDTVVASNDTEVSGKILLIEDEDMIRLSCSELLLDYGYDVECCENGIEGVETFKRIHAECDLVILDMMMPKMNGYETLLKLKEIDSNVKCVVTSGFTDQDTIDNIKALGVEGCLQKPVVYNSLFTLIDSVIKK